MFKFYRTALVAGAVALGLAACGDDVTVGDGGSTRGVTSVNVTPANASVAIGQTVTLSAAVIADSGVSTAIDWSSSNQTIATVSSIGAVTGVAVGTTTIIAKSHVDTTRQAAVQLTVVAGAQGITSFSITPPTMGLAPGQSSQALANIQTAPGVTAPPVTWTSLTPAIATVSSTGLITGVSQGSAVITGAITSGGVTLTGSVNVTVGQGASVSIASVTVGGTNGVPVNLNNVAGQVDVNMNLNAGVQSLDSLNVYVQQGATTKRLATQAYGNSIPSAGPVTLSINTANFTKNATTGIATVDIFNGPGSFVVRVFPHSTAGGSVTNCQVGANDPNCSHPQSLVFNNADGWSADIIRPSVAAVPATPAGGFATSTVANAGQTYVGGPGTTGQTTVELYAVIYNDNPANPSGSSLNRCNNVLGNGTGCINSVTWTIGTPANYVGGPANFDGTCEANAAAATQTTPPFKKVYGSGTGATKSCAGYQNTSVTRDNVIVFSSIDGSANPFTTVGAAMAPVAPAVIGSNNALISNTMVFASTPDSIRADYTGPTVNAPSVVGVEGLNWVNANWKFTSTGLTDAGVGPATTTWKAFVGTGSPTVYTTPLNTGNDLAETNTNTTDGYTAQSTAADLLGNTNNSAVAGTFGVDKTAPVLRYSAVAAPSGYASIYTGGGTGTVLDSTTYAAYEGLYGANVIAAGATTLFLGTAAGNNDSVRTEALDGRSGIFRARGFTVRYAQTGTNNCGAAGMCTTVQTLNTTSGGAGFTQTTIDGWRILPALHVTANSALPGYYTTVEYVVDAAGNVSGCPTVGTVPSGTGSVVIDGSVCLAGTAGSSAPSTTANTNPGLGSPTGAGTNANLFIRRTLALDPGQPAVTGLTPSSHYMGDSAATFSLASQNDLEVIDARLRMEYRDSSGTTANYLTTGNAARTKSAGLVYSYALSDAFMSASPNGATGAGPTITTPTATPTGSTVALGYFTPVALRFDASIINPQTTALTIDRLNISIVETCLGAASPVASCAINGDPITVGTAAGQLPRVIPDSAGVRVRDVFGSFVFNTTPGAAFGVSTDLANPILSATVLPGALGYTPFTVAYDGSTSCPQGGNINGACVIGANSINFRADVTLSSGAGAGVKVFRATEALSRTLPIFTRVDLFGLSGTEWVFIARITVPNPVSVGASCAAAVVPGTVQGCDNGFERYWLYSFTAPAGFTQYRALGVNTAGNGLFSTVIP